MLCFVALCLTWESVKPDPLGSNAVLHTTGIVQFVVQLGVALGIHTGRDQSSKHAEVSKQRFIIGVIYVLYLWVIIIMHCSCPMHGFIRSSSFDGFYACVLLHT